MNGNFYGELCSTIDRLNQICAAQITETASLERRFVVADMLSTVARLGILSKEYVNLATSESEEATYRRALGAKT